MANKNPRNSSVRSKTSVKAIEEAPPPAKQPSRWRVICQPKKKVFIGWTVATVLLLTAIFLYFLTSTWPSLEHREKMDFRARRQVVVILISGMRWDLLDTLPDLDSRGFRRFFAEGVQVAHVKSVFPNYQLPSWTTLQTGLYPESHGILGGLMYDKKARKVFDEQAASVKEERWWQEREPIWITATKQGKRVATMEWNNADVPFAGLLPEVAHGYTASRLDFPRRILDVLQFLREDFSLVMMAYDGVENATLCCGPFSNQVRTELRHVDLGLRLLFSGVVREERQRYVQVLLVSDRGYEDVCELREPPPPTPPSLENLPVSPDDVIAAVTDRRMLLVYAWPGDVPRLQRNLDDLPGYATLSRKNIPTELHYKGGKWAPDILLFPVAWNRSRCVHQRAKIGFDRSRKWEKKKEKEIFEPTAPTLLLGWGTGFKSNEELYPPIRLVDVYQVIAYLLDVKPLPHNGSWAAVKNFLTPWENP